MGITERIASFFTGGERSAEGAREDASLVVTHAEICMQHGTGALLRRLLADEEHLVVVRSRRMFPENEIGGVHLHLEHGGTSRRKVRGSVRRALGGHAVRRILCVPFFPDELLTAIAAHDLAGAPLCTYIMDDQNIHERGIPDELMEEALGKSALRLAISPQLRDAYEEKFRVPVSLLPPVVPRQFFATEHPAPADDERSPRGILIGNLWSKAVTRRFRETVAGSGIEIDWFGNAGKPFFEWDAGELARDGVHLRGFLETEDALAARLRTGAFAVLPTGTIDAEDEQPWLSRLSLPSRIMFIMASSHLPIVVLGSRESAAASVVEELGIGVTCAYDSAAFNRAVAEVTAPARRAAIAAAAADKARVLAAEGVLDWIWASLARGAPLDDVYDRFLPRKTATEA